MRAVGVAISLDQPFRILNILSGDPVKVAWYVAAMVTSWPRPPGLLDEGGAEGEFSRTILALRDDQICELLTMGATLG